MSDTAETNEKKPRGLSDEAKQALRASVIAGPGDCVLTQDEAAALMHVSTAWLRASDVPRASVAGVPKYLKSQCLAYVRVRLSARILEEKAS